MDAPRLPVDTAAAHRLAERGLRMEVLDGADTARLRVWRTAVSRGFLDPANTEQEHAEVLPDLAGKRVVGVYDDSAAEPGTPVATIDAWPAPVSLPGGDVPAWAISAVTVAATHRRRGIARAMLEAELRTAASAGFPVAMLDVSEATIYGRYGFGPATRIAELTIDTRRARWIGRTPPGRVHLVGRDALLAVAADVYERSRHRAPGGVGLEGLLLTRLLGRPSDDAALRARRFARYDDADGTPQGFLAFSTRESETAAPSVLTVHHLAAATDDASAALWRLALEHDLIGEVVAPLRSVDEPLVWMIDDQRAVRTTAVGDHLWVRVLDPVAALSARTYAGPGRAVLAVTDPAGFADGRHLLDVGTDGRATVTAAGEREDGVPEVALDASVLGSLLLGGVRAAVLAQAGRVAEREPGAAAALDRLVLAPTTPWSGIWF
ncbi:MAG: GNAT family N-acetyltransferase [Amnibacterium sp.]